MAHFMAGVIASEIVSIEGDALSYLDEWVKRRPDAPEPLAFILMAAYRLGERDARKLLDFRESPA